MTERFDDAVVGAGILGLAHAVHLAARGRKVLVVERSPLPQGATGASIRNFGMIWPIGQPAGELYRLASRSRDLWLKVTASAGLWREQTGSLHLAYAGDEAAVLREYIDACSSEDLAPRWISPSETLSRWRLARVRRRDPSLRLHCDR